MLTISTVLLGVPDGCSWKWYGFRLYHNYWYWLQFCERNHSILLRRSLVFAFHFTFRHLCFVNWQTWIIFWESFLTEAFCEQGSVKLYVDKLLNNIYKLYYVTHASQGSLFRTWVRFVSHVDTRYINSILKFVWIYRRRVRSEWLVTY
jgi:hypothetical protein